MLTVAARQPRISSSSFGSLLVVISVLAMQGGQAVAKLGFPLAGPLPITALRFGLGAIVLWAIFRPRLPTDRRTLLAVVALGTSLAGVNGFIYKSIEHLPLGLAVTVQFVGALMISLFRSRRLRHLIWALLAAAGVVVINYVPEDAPSVVGIAFALASAACWGAYILLSAHVGARISGGGGITLATAWAALLTVPLGVVSDPRAFVDLPVLGVGLVVAVLCTVVANSLELHALRHIPARVFGVLVSLEPAVAALLGLMLLHEHLTPFQWLAIAATVSASIGVTTDQPGRRTIERCGGANSVQRASQSSRRMSRDTPRWAPSLGRN